jgi:hypothetical protein
VYSALSDNEPVYAQVDRHHKTRTPERSQRTHRRHMSACVQVPPAESTDGTGIPIHEQLVNDLTTTTDSLNLNAIRREYIIFNLRFVNEQLFLFHFIFAAKSVCIESDITHDYAEIYTPSREKLPWDKSNNKPPTPPLHRFPSWESRIYQVANEGLSTVPTSQVEPTIAAAANSTAVHPTRVVTSQGYCDISVPVYATVKGVCRKYAYTLNSPRYFSYIFLIPYFLIFFYYRGPVKLGPVHSLVTRQMTLVTVKVNIRTRQTRTVLLPESRTVVVRTTQTRHCLVPVPVRAIRLRQRSRRLNTILPDHHRKVRIYLTPV